MFNVVGIRELFLSPRTTVNKVQQFLPCIFILFVVFLSGHLFAQPVEKAHYTFQVVSHPLVFQSGRLYVGPDQRLWHTDYYQVAAFDGRQWQAFPSLSNKSNFYHLDFQDENTLLLGSRQEGLYRFDLTTQQLRQYRSEGLDEGAPPRNSVVGLCKSSDNTLAYTAGTGDLAVINFASGQSTQIADLSQIFTNSTIICDSAFAWILLHSGEVIKLEVNTGKVQTVGTIAFASTEQQLLLKLNASPIGVKPLVVNHNTLLLVGEHQLWQLNTETLSLTKFGLPFSKPISGIVRHANGDFWVSTKGAGLFQINESGDIEHHLSSATKSLPDDMLLDVVLSPDGWLFMLGSNALFQLDVTPRQLSYLQPSEDQPAWYSAIFKQDQSMVLLEEFSRILFFHAPSLALTDISPWIRQQLALAGEHRPLVISALHEHQQDEYWFSNNDTLIRFNHQQTQFTLFPGKSAATEGPIRRVRHIFTDSQQRLWFTDEGSVLHFDEQRQQLQRFPLANPNLPDRQKRFVKIQEDQQQRLWALGEFGLYQISDHALDAYFQYKGQGLLVDMSIDQHDALWLLTVRQLIRITTTQQAAEVEMYDLPAGIDTRMQSVVAWQNKVWVGTRNGLLQFDPLTEKWRGFTQGDGVRPYIAYQRGAFVQEQDLVFLTEKGLLRFDPKTMITQPTQTKISQVQIRSGTADWQVIPMDSPLVLPAAAHWLELELALTDFRYPDQLRFRYLLEGYDPTWNRSSSSSKQIYAGVPAGEYQLRAEVYYQHTQQVVTELQLPIHLLPAWYQTTIAKTIYALLVLLMVLMIYRYRQHRLKQIILFESEIAISYQRTVQAQQRQEELTVLGASGRELTAHLNINDVWHDFQTAVTQFIQPTQSRLLLTTKLSLDIKTTPSIRVMIGKPDVLCHLPFTPGICFDDAQKQHFVEAITPLLPTDHPEFIDFKNAPLLYLPVQRQQQCYAVIILAFEATAQPDHSCQSALMMLADFMAVALENIDAYQRMQQLQLQLLQQQQMQSLGRLVAGIAHEMNTPAGIALTATSMVGDILQKTSMNMSQGQLSKTGLEQSLTDAMQANTMVQRNIERLSGLIEQFKLLASVNTTPTFSQVAVWTLFKDLLQLRHLETPEISLELIIPEDELWLKTSSNCLQMVFQQLIDNIFVHAATMGQLLRIKVELQLEAQQLVIRISDNGPGLTPENQSKVMEPFFTTARHQGRIGLGLAIVHNMTTDLLGGNMHVMDLDTGGCCIELRLPLNLRISEP